MKSTAITKMPSDRGDKGHDRTTGVKFTPFNSRRAWCWCDDRNACVTQILHSCECLRRPPPTRSYSLRRSSCIHPAVDSTNRCTYSNVSARGVVLAIDVGRSGTIPARTRYSPCGRAAANPHGRGRCTVGGLTVSWRTEPRHRTIGSRCDTRAQLASDRLLQQLRRSGLARQRSRRA